MQRHCGIWWASAQQGKPAGPRVRPPPPCPSQAEAVRARFLQAMAAASSDLVAQRYAQRDAEQALEQALYALMPLVAYYGCARLPQLSRLIEGLPGAPAAGVGAHGAACDHCNASVAGALAAYRFKVSRGCCGFCLISQHSRVSQAPLPHFAPASGLNTLYAQAIKAGKTPCCVCREPRQLPKID